MLLFVAPYPDESNEKDGMFQRIAAIDRIFSAEERIYFQTSKLWKTIPTIEQKSELVKVYHMNSIIQFLYILCLARKARFVYVHSIYYARAIVPLYYLYRNIITDMHGLVPEELAFEGKVRHNLSYNVVESVVLHKSRLVVTVTSAMIQHFKNKYKNSKVTFCNMPIINNIHKTGIKSHLSSGKLKVIYAGGTHKWQNIDIMIEAIRSTIDLYDFTILSNDIGYFKHRFYQLGLEGRIKLASVSPEKVYSYYTEADLGFVLRDDIIINNVACPTKLLEYLSCGVVPIVIQPNIGDFAKHNYRYVLLSDFLKGVFLSSKELEEMISQNFKVIEALHGDVDKNLLKLVQFAHN
jgi:hypothetical protein